MDKRHVIAAYQRGLITLQECAQILGVQSLQVLGIVNEQKRTESARMTRKRPVNQ
jgi:predicted HTH domain antitoxin